MLVDRDELVDAGWPLTDPENAEETEASRRAEPKSIKWKEEQPQEPKKEFGGRSGLNGAGEGALVHGHHSR